jgi:hypothetical protein
MKKNLFERIKKGSANVQRFYESKLHAWAFDCQQNQSRRFTLAALATAFAFSSAVSRSSVSGLSQRAGMSSQ